MLNVWNPPDTGATLHLSRTVSEQDVELFADMTGAWDPLSYDDAFARGTDFGRTVVPSTALTAIVEAEIGARLVGRGAVVVQQAWEHPAPLFVGDTVDVEARVSRVLPALRETSLECVARRADGAEVLRGTCRLYTANRR